MKRKNSFVIESEFYDFTNGVQMTRMSGRPKENQHENETLGWEEHLEQIIPGDECMALSVRWWEYTPACAKKEGLPLVICMYAHTTNCWMQIAERESLVLLSFDYTRNVDRNRRHIEKLGPGLAEMLCYHEVVNKVIDKYNCDRSRIYINGLSYGEMSALYYVTLYENELAGAAFINGPSTDTNLKVIGAYEKLAGLPVIQIRSDGDLTYDDYPYEIKFSNLNKRTKKYLLKERTDQVLLNREIWFRANGITEKKPLVEPDGNTICYKYGSENLPLCYAELHDACHFVPADTPELIWREIFSRYKRNGDKIEKIKLKKPGSHSAADTAFLSLGTNKIFQNGEISELAAPVLKIKPPKKLSEWTYFGHYLSDCYESYYVPVDFLSKAFGIEYRIAAKKQTLTTVNLGRVSERINVKDAELSFDYSGKSYRILVNTCMAGVDGFFTDLKRPSLYIDDLLYIPVKEITELLNFSFCEHSDILCVSEKPCGLGTSGAELLKREIFT